MAHALGSDHFNLGFSAGAHLEPEMAEWIGPRRDWDFAVLELGVNLVTQLTTAQFEARARVFMDHIAATHGERWVFVTDILTAGPEFEANPRRAQFRAAVGEIVAALRRPRIRHVDGRKLLTRTTGLSLDLLHPSADGFAEIADRFGAEIRPALRATLPSN